MKCVGGPIDGKELPGDARWAEAITDDGRIARYEQAGGVYALRGHFVIVDGTDRVFVPLADFA